MEDIDVAIQNFKTAPNESRSSSTALQRSDSRDRDSQNTGLTLSGLLNAIDGVTSQKGRILFVTTNKESTLDPALTRAGRLDVHIEFFHAKREHAAQLFRRFYSMPSSAKSKEAGGCASSLDSVEVDALAERFAEAVPDGVLAMAQLQNYLMSHKHQPQKACDGVREWVAREQLKAEKRQARNEPGHALDASANAKPFLESDTTSCASDSGSGPTAVSSPCAVEKVLPQDDSALMNEAVAGEHSTVDEGKENSVAVNELSMNCAAA